MPLTGRRWRALATASLVAAAVLVGPTLFAHPTATTTFTITLANRETFDLAITTDPDALLTKLEALSAEPMSSGALTPAARNARLLALAPTLTEHLDLRFGVADAGGETRATLQLTGITTPDGQPAVVHFTGSLPAGASRATWRTSLVYGSYPLVIRRAGANAEAVQWLQGPQVSEAFGIAPEAPALTGVRALWQYFSLGFTHILPNGFDHILFVLGLFLLTPKLKSVVAQASAFTLAHSITLGLTLYGIVSVPASVVEPLIALSIAYVAFENLFTSDLKPWRLALVFGFGLLHGMGFAEALARLNLPRSAFFTTLVTFNVGVEAGQLAVVAMAVLAVRALAVRSENYRRFIVQPVSMAIALTGVFWTIQRVI